MFGLTMQSHRLLETIKFALTAALVVGMTASVTLTGLFFYNGPATTALANTDPLNSDLAVERDNDDTNNANNSANRPSFDGNGLAQLNLFGAVVKPPSNKEEKAPEPVKNSLADVEAPDTTLRLQLMGIFASDEEARSMAFIKESGKRDGKKYILGDPIPGNATVAAIFSNRVILDRGNGRLEALRFKEYGSQGSLLAQADFDDDLGDLPIGDGELEENIEEIPEEPPPDLPSSSDNEGEVRVLEFGAGKEKKQFPKKAFRPDKASEFVDKYKDQIQENPVAVLNEFGLKSVTEGQANGYRIGDKIPETVLNQMGLRPDDVVVSINGQPVGDVQSDKSKVDAMVKQGKAKVEIQRGRRRFVVSVPL